MSPVVELILSIIFFIVFTLLGIFVSPIIFIFGISDVFIVGDAVNKIKDAKHKKEQK